jgi:hypothetical protein
MVLADRDAAAQAHDVFNAHRVDLENPIMASVCFSKIELHHKMSNHVNAN